MIVYTKIPEVLDSCTTLQARIDMLNTILNGMESAMLKASTTGQFQEYKLDTGQTISEIRYRSLTELTKMYDALLELQQKLMARIDNNNMGRVLRAVPGQNFIG